MAISKSRLKRQHVTMVFVFLLMHSLITNPVHAFYFGNSDDNDSSGIESHPPEKGMLSRRTKTTTWMSRYYNKQKTAVMIADERRLTSVKLLQLISGGLLLQGEHAMLSLLLSMLSVNILKFNSKGAVGLMFTSIVGGVCAGTASISRWFMREINNPRGTTVTSAGTAMKNIDSASRYNGGGGGETTNGSSSGKMSYLDAMLIFRSRGMELIGGTTVLFFLSLSMFV
jgi:hypothetical protein